MTTVAQGARNRRSTHALYPYDDQDEKTELEVRVVLCAFDVRLEQILMGLDARLGTAADREISMKMLAIVSPGLKVLFERFGKPEVINKPDVLRPGGTGAVIACNHVGWSDSLWIAYAVYPRRLRYMSKRELFNSTLAKWVLEHVGSVPIDRANPAPTSIKIAVGIAERGDIILMFPSGTRGGANLPLKRGAATVALHARVPLVPVFYQGPKQMKFTHLVRRPQIRVTFGRPISTVDMPIGKQTASTLTRQLQAEIHQLESATNSQFCAAH